MVSASILSHHPRRFAVIGAGGAVGLATLQVSVNEFRDHIRAGDIEVVGFEQREDIGGIWLAEPRPDPSKQEWPETPAYDSLKTDIPHPIMYFPLHFAPPFTPLFTDAHTVNDYMRSYVDKFGLRQYIQFNTQVTAATWDDSTHQWTVNTRPYGSHSDKGAESVSHFDHLLLTNGHNRHPFTPDIDRFEDWAASGSRELHTLDMTIHSVSSVEEKDSERIIQRGAISHFTADGFVHFKNGKQEHVDRVIFATGYEYDFPFLTQLPVEQPEDSSDHLYNSRFHIYPLALHTYPLRAAFPPGSLAFIGLPNGVPAFNLAEFQATLAIRQMMGKISLDFDEELTQTLERNDELQKKHSPPSEVAISWHKFGKENGNAHDFLDLLLERANDSMRIPKWKRDFVPVRSVILPEWRKLEALGLAKKWVDEVGKNGIQDWIDLMRRAKGSTSQVTLLETRLG